MARVVFPKSSWGTKTPDINDEPRDIIFIIAIMALSFVKRLDTKIARATMVRVKIREFTIISWACFLKIYDLNKKP